MKKFTILLAVLLFGLVATASAQVPMKPFTIYASAGVTTPMSPDDFKDGWGTGYHANAQLGFNMYPKTEFVLNLEYHKFGADADFLEIAEGGDKSVIMAGGDFKLNLGAPMVPIKPFLLVGAGIAVLSTSDVTIDVGPDIGTFSIDSENKLYYQIGGGIEFTNFFIRAKFVTIKDGASDVDLGTEENASMMPISIGIKF